MRAARAGSARHGLPALLGAVAALLCLAAAAQAAPPVTIASQGGGAGQVDDPIGVAVDQSSGDLYVADGNNFRIDKFDAEGNFLLAWGFGVADNESAVLQTCGPQATPPTAKCFHPGSINTAPGAGNIGPDSLAVDQSSHYVYVADSSKRRVTKFGPDGEFIFMVGKSVNASGATQAEKNICTLGDLEVDHDICGVGQNGSGPDEFFISPTAVIVDASNPNHVWVLDGTRLVQLDSSGSYVSQAAIPSGSTPTGLARDPAGDFYTLKASANEEQQVGFTGFAKGDTYTLANLPASCFAASTAPIEYVDTGGGGIIGKETIQKALDAKCGADSPVRVISEPPKANVVFLGALSAQNFAQLSCTKDTGSGSCSVSAIRDGAPGAVRKLGPSGSPVDTLSEVGTLDATGSPQALVPDAAGNLYVGDNVGPYHFLKFNPAGEQTAQFGARQVITNPFGAGPKGSALAIDEGEGALYAASSISGAESAVQRLTLPALGPLPDNPAAENVLPTTATLTATLNPEGHATEYHFEYGTSAAYGSETPTEALPGVEYESEEVSAPIEHLLPETEYHFRPAASNEKGTAHSEDATFTTPPAVKVDAQWADEVAAASATFKAELDPLGVPAEWRLEYGTDESYGAATEFQALGSGFGDVPVARQITGLAPDTLYHYRFAATDVRDGVKYLIHGPDQAVLTAIGALGFSLPDGRAWEQVTPLHKRGGRIVPPWLGFTQASGDGGALTFLSIGPVSEAEGNRIPEASQSLAHRGAGGWSSESISPPHETAQLLAESEFRLFSSDLCRAAVEPRGLRVKGPGPLSAEASEWTPYLRENCASPPGWRPLVTGKVPFADVCPGTEFGGEEEGQLGIFHPLIEVVGGSPDLGAAIVKSTRVALNVPPTCDAEGVSGALYEWSAGALRLVSELPDGKVGGQATLGSAGAATGSIRGAVSGDSRYVYWSRPENALNAFYVRDTALGQTVRLDEPLPHSFGGQDRPVFQGASAEGTRAFFTDTRHLTPDAGETGADLYQCEIVESGGEEKCALRDLTPETPSREAAEVQGVLTAIGEEGSDLYFVANGALAPGAVHGDCAPPSSPTQRCNLYHAHRDEGGSWSLRLVAVLSGADEAAWGGSLTSGTVSLAATASPDGRYLAFMSELPLSGYDNRDAKSGEADEEVFRYDSEANSGAGELACVSCNPSGARPRGAVGASGYQLPSDWRGLWTGSRLAATLPDPETPGVTPAFYRPRAMLDNGRVLFNALDGLVPADSNGTADAYEYEPWGLGSCTSASKGPALAQAQGGGCVALLSSGTSERESGVIDSSASGEDIFIITASRLSALDEDPDYDLYDARVGGVAPQREENPECLGEACQSPAPAPQDATPATLGLRGAGNLAPPASGRRCPKGRRKVRRRGKVHCAKRGHLKRHRHHGRAGS